MLRSFVPSFINLIEVCWGTKQCQHHGDTGITIILKNIHEKWDISLSIKEKCLIISNDMGCEELI